MGDTKEDCEKLFLLEVLVDNLLISNSSLNLDKNLLSNLADTCVMFQFLHYPPLVVCESDFLGTAGGRADSSNLTFKSGKSCFFSLRVPRRPLLPVPMDLKVTVLRRLKEGVLPDKLEIGKTSIEMSDEFSELLKVNTDENCDSLPLSKNKKGIFEIQDEFGKTVGSVTAFVRLSCFGKLIITQFSLNKDDEKSYLFKGTDVSKVCAEGQSRPCGDKEKLDIPSRDQRYGSEAGKRDRESLTRKPVPPAGEAGMPGPGRRDLEYNEPRPYGSAGGGGRPKAGPRDWDYMKPQPYGSPGDYGPRRQCPGGRPMEYPYMPPPQAQPYPKGRPGQGPLCDCPYPVPPSVMAKYNQSSGKNLNLTPGEVGLEDDRVIFQLPLKKPGEPLTEKDKQADSSVYYKLTSAEETKDGTMKNTVQVTSDDLKQKGAVGPVSGLPLGDGHDVFLLKIGKKCDGDKKRNLELELRTPKMKEPKPPMTDQNTQYLESDIPKPEGEAKGKGKKGKDKGGKGKGKGKGKK